jgi:hypothetical protein
MRRHVTLDGRVYASATASPQDGLGMKRVGLLAVAALLLGASAPAASAAPSGPLNGAEAICANQGGNWHPSGFPTFPPPTCNGLGLIVWNDQVQTGLGSTQLTAANSACRAAGYGGAQRFGRPFMQDGRLGFFVVQWSCVGSRSRLPGGPTALRPAKRRR